MHEVQLNGKGQVPKVEDHHLVPMSLDPYLGISSAEGSQDEHVVPLKDLLSIIRRRLLIIMLVAVVLAGAVVGYDLLQTPMYQASVRLLVGQEQTDYQVSGNLGNQVEGLQQITQTMAKAAVSRPVAENVIEKLDLGMSPEDFLKNMSVSQEGTTQLIQVSYKDASPEKAQQIADAIGDAFSGRVSNISPSANGVTVMVWEPAATPKSPVSPNLWRDGILALALGGMLGIGLAFLLEFLDDRWRSPEEVEKISGVPSFGVVPAFKGSKSKKGES